VLALVPAGIAWALMQGPSLDWEPAPILIIGLIAFGIVFAINSAVHSYLILAYADADTSASITWPTPAAGSPAPCCPA